MFLTLSFWGTFVYSQDQVYFQSLPVPSGVEMSNDPTIPNIAWNRWTTQNFTILSIDPAQGEYLKDNIEMMKSWTLTRWGLQDIKFSKECRIYCAPNKETMKKLFNIDSSFAEVKGDISYLWLVLDGKPSEIVPSGLTIISLNEYQKVSGRNYGWWVHRGIPNINLTLPQIRNNMISIEASLQKDNEIFFSKSIFTLTETEWKKLPENQKKLFDLESAAMCLLIRKEYGQNLFLQFLNSSYSENELSNILGFSGYNNFDITFKRYLVNLTGDIRANKTPDHYLQVSSPKK